MKATGRAARCAGARACDSTVWMEGMSRPCATPTATRAAAVAATLAAVPGVSRHAVAHSAKDAISVRRPPQRCAAHPPGTCAREGWLAWHAACAVCVQPDLYAVPGMNEDAPWPQH